MLTCTHTRTQTCFSLLPTEWAWREIGADYIWQSVLVFYVCLYTLFFLHQTDRELNCISWKCQDQSVKTAGMSSSIRGDASQCGAVGSLHLSRFTKPTIATTHMQKNWCSCLKCWIDILRLNGLICYISARTCVQVSMCIPTHPRASRCMGNGWPLQQTKPYQTLEWQNWWGRKEGKERKQLRLAVGWRENKQNVGGAKSWIAGGWELENGWMHVLGLYCAWLLNGVLVS